MSPKNIESLLCLKKPDAVNKCIKILKFTYKLRAQNVSGKNDQLNLNSKIFASTIGITKLINLFIYLDVNMVENFTDC